MAAVSKWLKGYQGEDALDQPVQVCKEANKSLKSRKTSSPGWAQSWLAQEAFQQTLKGNLLERGEAILSGYSLGVNDREDSSNTDCHDCSSYELN